MSETLVTMLGFRMEELTICLLGKPSSRTLAELRFGRKDSMSVVIAGPKRGLWCDHQDRVGGGPLQLIRRTRELDAHGAMSWARQWLGHGLRSLESDAASHQPAPDVAAQDAFRVRAAIRIWEEARPARGTIAEKYLATRRLSLPSNDGVIRFHPACPRGQVERLPALIAAFREIGTDELSGVLRIFLRRDGSGKANGKSKMMRGRTARSAIKLTPDADVALGLGVAEGLETALSVMERGWSPVWALGSAGAVAKFEPLPGIESLTIFADHGGGGIEAANACARQWAAAGHEVHVAYPWTHDTDWNDVLQETAA